MNCEKCGGASEVADSRKRNSGYIRRRRQCKACGHRFTTIELPLEIGEQLKDIMKWTSGEITKIMKGFREDE